MGKACAAARCRGTRGQPGHWRMLAAQANGQLILAPAGKLQTQSQSRFLGIVALYSSAKRGTEVTLLVPSPSRPAARRIVAPSM
jgi:hypothetical protein